MQPMEHGWRTQRIRDRAHNVLERGRRFSRFGKAYSRYLKPALAMILAWALGQVYFLKI
ncbi:MAG: hypothetical protein JRJ87_25875 [Deltaproteobacteria bacterium]|nr:hypothetical protein [Deltaproteobacteria bacterium]